MNSSGGGEEWAQIHAHGRNIADPYQVKESACDLNGTVPGDGRTHRSARIKSEMLEISASPCEPTGCSCGLRSANRSSVGVESTPKIGELEASGGSGSSLEESYHVGVPISEI